MALCQERKKERMKEIFLRLLQSFFRMGDLKGDFAGDVFFTELTILRFDITESGVLLLTGDINETDKCVFLLIGDWVF